MPHTLYRGAPPRPLVSRQVTDWLVLDQNRYASSGIANEVQEAIVVEIAEHAAETVAMGIPKPGGCGDVAKPTAAFVSVE